LFRAAFQNFNDLFAVFVFDVDVTDGDELVAGDKLSVVGTSTFDQQHRIAELGRPTNQEAEERIVVTGPRHSQVTLKNVALRVTALVGFERRDEVRKLEVKVCRQRSVVDAQVFSAEHRTPHGVVQRRHRRRRRSFARRNRRSVRSLWQLGNLFRARVDRADVVIVRPDFGGGVREDERHLAIRGLVRVRRRHRRRRRADGAATVDVDVLIVDGVLQDDAVVVEITAHGSGDVIVLALQDPLLGRQEGGRVREGVQQAARPVWRFPGTGQVGLTAVLRSGVGVVVGRQKT